MRGRLLRWPLLTLLVVIVAVYSRVFSAAFVNFDDDIHVYANPFLNPPTLASVARLWRHAYEELYVPLAYTLFAVLAAFAHAPSHVDRSVGHLVSLDPAVFHTASVALHVANAWLCFVLVRRLSGRATSALICTLVFALHPLQLESVAWISELRGLTSAACALTAVYAFVRARAPDIARLRARALLAAAAGALGCALLCKPSAAVLPLVALVLDRAVLGTPWRRALLTAAGGGALVLPFVLATRSLQSVSEAGQSVWWQRPFIAGDAVAFYLSKLFLPTDLCVDYGRTPSVVLASTWSYVAWVVPLGLLAVAYVGRRRRPQSALGVLLFVTLLLPTLGFFPFSFQAYSTVADRYVYLALIGVGLVAADVVEGFGERPLAARGTAAVLAGLAVISFAQSGFWASSASLLRHALEVNPGAAFAYNNLGDVELGNGDSSAALADFQACVRVDPTRTKAYLNLAEIYAASGEPAEAEAAVAQATRTQAMTADDFSNLGIVLMKMNQPERAIAALSTATAMDPTSPVYVYNEANVLSGSGQFEKAEVAYRRCIALAPTLAGAHVGLGIVLAETQRLPAAVAEFRAAVRLEPDDAGAVDNLKRAEAMLAGRGL